MSQFKPYPAYKDSGVVWLGEVPEHWSLKRFRYAFEESPEKITDEVVGEMLSVSGYRGIEVKQYDDEGRRRTDDELFGYRVVRSGQLVVNTMWLNYAGLGVSEYEGHVSPAYRSYWIDPVLDKRFIHHLMRSGTYVQGYTHLLTGIRPNSLQMGRDDLMVFPMLFPSKPEQTKIAHFLDHETARIDTLIEEQQRLIELLKEKRQAVISRAVTKGLDPTVPMKDSGVEWLGEVPAHWDVKKLKHIGRVVGGFAFKSTDFCSEGHPVLKISNVGHLSFEWGDRSYLPEDFCESHSAFAAPEGALIFAMTRPVIAGGIKVARLEDESLPLVNQRVGFMVVDDVDMSRYLLTSTQSDSFLSQFKNNLTTTNQPNISSEGIECISIAVPPLSEMKTILGYCEQFDTAVQRLINDALRGTGLLQERRSALISAAVTGKIDVRGWQPPASVSSPVLEEAV